MGSLDAYKDEILSQLIHGDWKALFPKKIYDGLADWFKNQTGEKLVNIRFIFSSNGERYAVYLICNPGFENGKVDVRNMEFGEKGYPLAIPPSLYKLPLYCMPKDLLEKILRKKSK